MWIENDKRKEKIWENEKKKYFKIIEVRKGKMIERIKTERQKGKNRIRKKKRKIRDEKKIIKRKKRWRNCLHWFLAMLTVFLKPQLLAINTGACQKKKKKNKAQEVT